MAVKDRIKSACKKCGRNPSEIQLIGVSKTRTAEEVISASRAGLADFGENRVQEADEKKGSINKSLSTETSLSTFRWHLIGHLQSNKVNKAVELFDVIHSVDTTDLAHKLGEACFAIGKSIDCYVQVNASGEGSKSGASFEDAEFIASRVVAQISLKLVGFMTIGPMTSDETAIESCFIDLRRLRDRLSLLHPEWGNLGLSMGMSGDYELAIKSGATAIRIGSALFGARDYSQATGSF